jgi:hypothetical protein
MGSATPQVRAKEIFEYEESDPFDEINVNEFDKSPVQNSSRVQSMSGFGFELQKSIKGDSFTKNSARIGKSGSTGSRKSNSRPKI